MATIKKERLVKVVDEVKTGCIERICSEVVLIKVDMLGDGVRLFEVNGKSVTSDVVRLSKQETM